MDKIIEKLEVQQETDENKIQEVSNVICGIIMPISAIDEIKECNEDHWKEVRRLFVNLF